jgi:hypothetical protein
MLSFLVQRSIVYRLRTATETECLPRQHWGGGLNRHKIELGSQRVCLPVSPCFYHGLASEAALQTGTAPHQPPTRNP